MPGRGKERGRAASSLLQCPPGWPHGVGCPQSLPSTPSPPCTISPSRPLLAVCSRGSPGDPGCAQQPHWGRGQLHKQVAEDFSFFPAECPAGTFGVNCSGSCYCGGAPCDRVTGQCLCPPGKTGDDCGAGEWQQCPAIPPHLPCHLTLGGPNPGPSLGIPAWTTIGPADPRPVLNSWEPTPNHP